MKIRIVKSFKKHSVLKLVHPGGFVEIHQKQITADEVMKKNPRHCVTRPDFFRYPWVVVKPQSILNPGSVFYIVPFHTIHCLMQRYICPSQNYLLQQQDLVDSSVDLIYFHQFLKEQSPDISQKRTKVDFRIEEWPDDAVFPKCLIRNNKCSESDHCQQSLIKSRFELEHFGDSPKEKSYLVDNWLAACDYEVHKEFEQHVISFFEPRPAFSLDVGGAFPEVISGLEPKESKPMKSCLKKDNQVKSRGFKVTFILPDEDDEKIKVEVLKFQQTKSP